MLLALVGGSNSQNRYMRSNIHVLIVGDPGLGKSQLIRHVTQLAPRASYLCGKHPLMSDLQLQCDLTHHQERQQLTQVRLFWQIMGSVALMSLIKWLGSKILCSKSWQRAKSLSINREYIQPYQLSAELLLQQIQTLVTTVKLRV